MRVACYIMDFFALKPQSGVSATVRLPQPATGCGSPLLAATAKTKPLANLPTPTDKRSLRRAEQSRFRAQCRVAMSY